MIAVTTALVVLGIVVIVLVLWLGNVMVKSGFILGLLAGILISTTGLATGFRNFIVTVFASMTS